MKVLYRLIIAIMVVMALIMVISIFVNKPEPEYSDNSDLTQDTNEFVKLYSNGYTVETIDAVLTGYAEVFILRPDGSAKWLLIQDMGNGKAETISEKLGTWNAEESKIEIFIQGNAGLIHEEFEKNGSGYFTNYSTGRYLKPQ